MSEQELEVKTQEAVGLANMIVDDPESYEHASEQVLEIDGAIKKVKGFFAGIKAQAHAAWRGICDKESQYLSPLEEARTGLVKKISDYATEQERLRREAQARAEEEARAKAAEEKARLEAAAQQALEMGAEELAEALEEQAESTVIVPEIVAPVVDKTTRTAAGAVTQKKELEVTVTNLAEFLAAILAEKHFPAELVKVQDAKLKSWAKLHGLKTYPGLQIRETVAASFRRAG